MMPVGHHIPKAKYRVRNWPAYNAGLCQRGSITLWLSCDVTDGWKAPKRQGRGGEALYSDGAIEAMLTLGAVYHLRLRQTQGFTKSVFDLLGLDLPVASASTLCRRRKALSIEPWAKEFSEPLDLVLDSTGLKVFGQGEWCRKKHGRKPRRWKKVHIGLDTKSGMIVSHLMTDKDAGDPDQINDILDQIDRPIGCFMADGAYEPRDARSFTSPSRVRFRPDGPGYIVRMASNKAVTSLARILKLLPEERQVSSCSHTKNSLGICKTITHTTSRRTTSCA